MSSYEDNLRILEVLESTIEREKDLRFIQILWYLGVLESNEDRFYEESSDTYKRIKDKLASYVDTSYNQCTNDEKTALVSKIIK